MKLPFGWYLVKPFDRKTTADRNTFAGREELERQHMRALDHLLEADDYVVATIHPHASGKRAAATTIISLPRHWEAVARSLELQPAWPRHRAA